MKLKRRLVAMDAVSWFVLTVIMSCVFIIANHRNHILGVAHQRAVCTFAKWRVIV
jgi:hypothetical protein